VGVLQLFLYLVPFVKLSTTNLNCSIFAHQINIQKQVKHMDHLYQNSSL